jgi:hypothetical protein
MNSSILARFLKNDKHSYKVVCCYCKIIYFASEITEFSSSDILKSGILDVPLCPSCFQDNLINVSNLDGNTQNEKISKLDYVFKYLNNIKKNISSEITEESEVETNTDSEYYIYNNSTESESDTTYNSYNESKTINSEIKNTYNNSESDSDNYGFNESSNNSYDSIESEDKMGFNEISYCDDD